MHNKFKIYYFINTFNYDEINKLDKKVTIIYRNYEFPLNINIVKKIRDLCKLNRRKFFISNNLKVAKNLKLEIDITSNGFDVSLQDLTLLHKQGKIR